jgi:hypothetical protein
VGIWLRIEKILAYSEMFPFSVNYKYVMSYDTATNLNIHILALLQNVIIYFHLLPRLLLLKVRKDAYQSLLLAQIKKLPYLI